MATRTAPKTTPDMEGTSTSTSTEARERPRLEVLRSRRGRSEPWIPARILQKDGSWSSTPSNTAHLRPADEERRGKEDLFGDSCVRHERHRRVQTGQEGPSDSMPPLPTLRIRTAELPRGRGLRQMRRAASDGGMHQAKDVPAKCALCSGPHTASYRGYPKSPYNNRREAPASTPQPVAPKPAPRPAPKRSETQKPQPQPPKEAPTAMETDAPRPSTSTVKRSYATAVKKSAAKIVAKKPKASGKPKIPAATTGPKPAPKKPETPKPGKPAKPGTRIARTEPDAMSTLAPLIPLFQRINWTKLQWQPHFYHNTWRADQELDWC
ncbi:hypothetical protein Trydic_g16182 [Trypoxylus dichotomus]